MSETEVPGEFDSIVESIQREVTRLDAEIARLGAQRTKLSERRSRLRAAVKNLQPPAKRGSKPVHTETPEENIAAVQKFIEERNGELADGFTATELHRLILANGAPLLGKDVVRKSVLNLHERGVIRLDRKTQGGGNLYKLVGQ
jgi:hypothetical protein